MPRTQRGSGCYHFFPTWVHIVATMVWLGGITFMLFAAIPSARQVLAGEAGAFLGEVSRRFVPMANVSIMLLLLSGIFLIATGGDSTGEGIGGAVMLLKSFLFSTMVGIHFFRIKSLAPRIPMAKTGEEKSQLQRWSLNLVWVNLSVGLGVLLLSALASGG